MAELDRAAFGADRRAVLQTLAADFPDRFLVVGDPAGRLSGYLCAQGSHLGPWVARSPSDAKALLQAALSLRCSHPFQTIIPGANPAGIALLERHGFLPVRSNRHMRRGGARLLSRREMLYGQVSFAMG